MQTIITAFLDIAGNCWRWFYGLFKSEHLNPACSTVEYFSVNILFADMSLSSDSSAVVKYIPTVTSCRQFRDTAQCLDTSIVIRGSVLILKCHIIHGTVLYLELQASASHCGLDHVSLDCVRIYIFSRVWALLLWLYVDTLPTQAECQHRYSV